MKQCPTCNRSYADETLTYCLDDGSSLTTPYAPQETMRISILPTPYLPPTEVLPSTQPPSKQVRQRSNSLLFILAILLALVIGGGVVALIKFGNKEATPSSSSTTPTSTPTPNKGQANDTPTLTDQGVRNLISRWVTAQNSKNITAYQSCYGASFEGIKRTASGRSSSYDRNGWMSDRWRMIRAAEGLNVEVKNMNVNIQGDTATVEFDQYYRSLRYSDWGPKVIKVKMSPAGEKIVYEELKASYPL